MIQKKGGRFLQVEKYHVDVETGDGLTVGRSVIDTRGRKPGQPGDKVLAQPPNCTVALGADPAVFQRVLLATLAKVVAPQSSL
jgi:inosine-uridine nucleoside N-ribohydrolase